MHHVHESPPVMTVPLGLLAVGAVLAGMLGLPMVDPEGHFWAGAIFVRPDHNPIEEAHHAPFWVAVLPVIVAAVGIGLALLFYILRPGLPARLAERALPVYTFLYNKWYFDELYDALFVRPALRLGYGLWRGGDVGVIDAYGPDGIAATTVNAARRVVRLQTGYLYHYAFAMLIGVAALVTWYLFVIQR
jgi:NADH-quinone oxidoreductase subunit L